MDTDFLIPLGLEEALASLLPAAAVKLDEEGASFFSSAEGELFLVSTEKEGDFFIILGAEEAEASTGS